MRIPPGRGRENVDARNEYLEKTESWMNPDCHEAKGHCDEATRGLLDVLIVMRMNDRLPATNHY
jgi:hypothetical protein